MHKLSCYFQTKKVLQVWCYLLHKESKRGKGRRSLSLLIGFVQIAMPVRYTAMLEDGTVFEKRGIDETQPLKFVTDEGEFILIISQPLSFTCFFTPYNQLFMTTRKL